MKSKLASRDGRAALIAAIGIVAAGCAVQVVRLSKAGAGQQEFMQDRYACLQQSQQSVSGGYVSTATGTLSGFSRSGVQTNFGLYLACMNARGYQRDPNGTLVPPANAMMR